MIVIGLLFGVVGIGFLCWLLFSLAVDAFPFFAAVSAGLWAYHSDTGPVGAIFVGILAGGATLVVGAIAVGVTAWSRMAMPPGHTTQGIVKG